MTISTPVLIGIFLLCCTGCAKRACSRLCLNPGCVAALCLAASLLSGVVYQPLRMLSVHPASLLLLSAAVFPIKRLSLYGLLVAFTGATLGWLMQTLFPAFPEPCSFAAAPVVLLSVLFLREQRERLWPVLLAPLLTGGLTALSDWYLFDSTVIHFGSGGQLDTQACGGLLLLALLSVPRKKSVPRGGFHQNEA